MCASHYRAGLFQLIYALRRAHCEVNSEYQSRMSQELQVSDLVS